MRCLAAEAAATIGAFGPDDLATLAWASARSRHAPAALFRAMAPRVPRALPGASPRNLANLAWAFAAAGFHDRPLLLPVAEASRRRAGEFKTQELASVSWALAPARVCAPDALDELAARALSRLGELRPQEHPRSLVVAVSAVKGERGQGPTLQMEELRNGHAEATRSSLPGDAEGARVSDQAFVVRSEADGGACWRLDPCGEGSRSRAAREDGGAKAEGAVPHVATARGAEAVANAPAPEALDLETMLAVLVPPKMGIISHKPVKHVNMVTSLGMPCRAGACATAAGDGASAEDPAKRAAGVSSWYALGLPCCAGRARADRLSALAPNAKGKKDEGKVYHDELVERQDRGFDKGGAATRREGWRAASAASPTEGYRTGGADLIVLDACRGKSDEDNIQHDEIAKHRDRGCLAGTKEEGPAETPPQPPAQAHRTAAAGLGDPLGTRTTTDQSDGAVDLMGLNVTRADSGRMVIVVPIALEERAETINIQLKFKPRASEGRASEEGADPPVVDGAASSSADGARKAPKLE
ncbi:unnamed protein product [Prorocentrum cordatum]|uniref:Uncharacterized protein n=1 Tax=Prorocentrum cordatum TaxID=2364126 RepID=A0ABN9Q2E0_9DINO|nr:unnamed protein product [Polarella glacialis]